MIHSSPALQIPGYRIVRPLGQGGMATVYLASQESLSRLVAIKVLARTPDEDGVRRFENEARTIARLEHPHIVSLFEVGRTPGGQIYYTMPYLPNGDLSTHPLGDRPLRVLEIIRALTEALRCAHEQGIVHRDVKPENVLFDALDRPLLADFGIAFSAGGLPRMTREGATMGSSGYMSPEQARGKSTDGRSDLYSLGVVCYEMLTGELPFAGSDALAVALAHIEKPVPRLPLGRRLWQPLIDRALAKSMQARFQSAEEMLAALDMIEKRLRAQPSSGPAEWGRAALERIADIPRRRRALAAGALLLLLFLSVLAGLPRRPEPAASPLGATAAGAMTASPALVSPPPLSEAAAPEPATREQADAAEAQARTGARARHLDQAAALVRQGHLLAPAGASAADHYLAILADEPGQRDAMAGLRRLLATQARNAALAIAARNGGAALTPIDDGIALIGRGQLRTDAAFSAFVAPIHAAIEQRRAALANPLDAAALADLKPLLPSLSRIDSAQARALQADFDRLAQLLRGEGRFQDAGGPWLRMLPGAAGERRLAITLDAISRGAYASFVNASARAPSRCRESTHVFARSKGLSWLQPGFAQGDDQAVVCVNWEDANAYAAWLSGRSDARYRLPTRQEWLALAAPQAPAALRLWSGSCAKTVAEGDPCNKHAFFSATAQHDSVDDDIGYVNMGFRLVREVPLTDTVR